MLHTVRRKLERADSIDDEGRLSAEGGRGPCVVAKRTRKVKALTVALTGSRERNERVPRTLTNVTLPRVPAPAATGSLG